MIVPLTVVGLAATLCLVASARGGVTGTTLPTLSEGKAAQLVALLPGVIKKNRSTRMSSGPTSPQWRWT